MSTAELPVTATDLDRTVLPPVIGSPVERIDAVEKVTGRAVYAGDNWAPRMLHGAVVRSPYASARILNVDTSRAERLPGVHAVVTGADTAGVKWGAFRPDLYPLAVDRVRYVGDEVAAVAARDPETARLAAGLIRVEYEVLPAVLSLDEALAEGAPLVHGDAPGNVAHEFGFDRGGADAWFDRSDVIVEGTWQTTRQWHGSLETIGCTAEWSQDRVSLWVNTQTPFLARQRYATALGLPLRAVRVVQTEIGGGFGGKSGDDNTSVICALLARRAGRPVQLVNTREEEFLASRPRIPMRYTVRLGFTKDGLVTAKDIEVIADNGAYTGKAQAVLGAATVRHDALFNYRAVRARSRLVYTNLEPTGALRGFGNPSADWAVGQAWDLAAEKLGIDVPDLFLLNAVESGSVSPHNHRISSCELKQCISKAAKAIDWEAKRAARKPNRGLAMGVSVHVSGRRSFGDYDGSSAIVRLTEDGRATVIVGEGEIGTGAHHPRADRRRRTRPARRGRLRDPPRHRPRHARTRRARESGHLCRGQRGQAGGRTGLPRSAGVGRPPTRSARRPVVGGERHCARTGRGRRRGPGERTGGQDRACRAVPAERPADRRHRLVRQPLRVPRREPVRQ
ncbi:hypothetical protein GCM10010121_002310 [Streptomyces brasiliensis]|uniref:Aldehyde oxidase/xanthine dehydrogenase a/b hammerhead domain-containing protein n=1 Tax=Streptomyces brasiliensis TaxID=1954 RepID=A0A917K2S1_9ACTN|nr:hypothetical protein GCM10010121_002310 [Streptomyces brasiliensis]